jgi:hypothetical protein
MTAELTVCVRTVGAREWQKIDALMLVQRRARLGSACPDTATPGANRWDG